MHTSHLYNDEQLLLIGGRNHCLPFEKDDEEA
jgi:hypothetical protein